MGHCVNTTSEELPPYYLAGVNTALKFMRSIYIYIRRHGKALKYDKFILSMVFVLTRLSVPFGMLSFLSDIGLGP